MSADRGYLSLSRWIVGKARPSVLCRNILGGEISLLYCITKYQELGDLQIIKIYFTSFCGLETSRWRGTCLFESDDSPLSASQVGLGVRHADDK